MGPSAEVEVGFRGRNPPASLKHDIQRMTPTELRGFRGRNPPASLKRRLRDRHDRQEQDVSGGEIPRPH